MCSFFSIVLIAYLMSLYRFNFIPLYYGWGIHLTPHGWLYNVSGSDAVEIRMKTGKKYRIGTDVPEELERAISRSIQ